MLVLQGDTATWTLWRGARRVAIRREPLGNVRGAAPRCPWPSVGETLVDVVADSPLDEIDRVVAPALARAPGGVLGRWRRALLGLGLARAHPEAAVRAATAAAAPLAATLLRAELPDEWACWLAALQRHGVTVRVLHSAIRLRTAARVVARSPDGDVLEVTRGGGALRHLLLRSGCPTFTRVVPAGDAVAERTALEETLAHLAERHGLEPSRVRVEHAGAAGRKADAADATAVDDDDASRLAALALDAGRLRRAGPESPALLAKWRWRGELLRLRAITALTVAVAFWAVVSASVHGIGSARDRARAIASEQALAARVARLDDAVGALHPEPERAAAALARLDAHGEGGAAEAVLAPLGFVAEVLTAHPSVRIDRLSWTADASAPSTADADGGSGTSAAGVLIEIAGRIDGTDRSAAAARSPPADESRPGVRERQRGFEAFVADLRGHAEVAALDVRLSPAAAAARGGESHSEDYALDLRYESRTSP